MTPYIQSVCDEAIEKCVAIRGNKAYDGSYAAPREAYREVLKEVVESLLRKAMECVAEQYQIPEGYEKDEYQYGKSCGSYDTRQTILASLQALGAKEV